MQKNVGLRLRAVRRQARLPPRPVLLQLVHALRQLRPVQLQSLANSARLRCGSGQFATFRTSLIRVVNDETHRPYSLLWGPCIPFLVHVYETITGVAEVLGFVPVCYKNTGARTLTRLLECCNSYDAEPHHHVYRSSFLSVPRGSFA